MKPKLIRITTVPLSLHLLIKGQPNYMQRNGFEVKLASAMGKEIPLIEKETEIKVKIFPFTREITLFYDLKSLWLTYKFFKEEKPQIIHTHTPKAGIVGMLAAKFAGVPLRMHTVAGLPLMEANGFKRKVLNFIERLTSWAATNVYPNSFVLKEFMEEEKLAPRHKLKVIGKGSSNGIDIRKYSKGNFSKEKIEEIKSELGIHKNDVIFCFVGRIVKDKGINELLSAFGNLSKENKKIKLLLVGSEEKELDPINKESQQILKNNKQVISVGWQEDIRLFLAISDIFVFPSYREGFPNVVMQAGAMGLPVLVTNINGNNEIVMNGKNGITIPVKDEKALLKQMELLATNIDLREKLSVKARDMIVHRYRREIIWNELLKEYVRLMDENNIEHGTVII